MTRAAMGALLAVMGSGFWMGACSGDDPGGTGGDGDGSSNGSSSGSGFRNGGDFTTSDGTDVVEVSEIPGGGVNAGPLAPGCGPDTAQQCAEPGGGCNPGTLLGDTHVQVVDAGSLCFFGDGEVKPSATAEYITEVVNGEEYVHLRVIFDPDFVDTTFGECSAETGWPSKGGPMGGPMGDTADGEAKPGHTFKDLVGSDHVELKLYDCADDLAMHMKVDFISEDPDAACGYANLGVTGGEGEMYVGDADDVLAVSSSQDRNMNGCGYCDTEESPCPSGDGYAPSTTAPEYDFRMVYELWIDADAFGDAGFCRPEIEYVHASPAKTEEHTIIVEGDDCPPDDDDDDDCPPNYALYLSSEGQYLCAGPPEDGECADGYELDLTSEGELCIPAD